MKIIRGTGKNRCERTIDFSRPLKYYDNPIVFYGKGFGISEVYFWDHETIRATVGKDRYELVEGNSYAYEQLKNNVELLFALHGL